MKPHETLALLRQFAIEKAGLKRRHETGAERIGQYDFNNTYQYVIGREEAHMDWLRRAVASLGGSIPDEVGVPPVPSTGKGRDLEQATIADDARLLAEFVARWRDRIELVENTRLKLMLRVVIGEVLEQQRFFEQALAGRKDLLGRRTSPGQASGTVLPTRWIE